MTSEDIIAILSAASGLWKLVSVLIVGFIIFYCRKQIREFIKRITKFRFKGCDAELADALPESNSKHETDDKSRMDAPPLVGEETNDASVDSLKTEVLGISNMIKAVDLKELSVVYSRLLSSETDPHQKIKLECMFYHLSFELGDSNALENLRKMLLNPAIKDPLDISSVHNWLGMLYDYDIKNYPEASTNYLIASKNQTDIQLKAIYLVSAAKCIHKSNDKEQAFETIMKAVQTTEDNNGLAELYKGFAELYELDGNLDMQAITIAKALEYCPNDKTLLFQAGYKYATKFQLLSFYNYSELLKYDRHHAFGLNNIGVLYDKLKMPCAAIENYKRAYARKNSLAGSNLASEYMSAGFIDEAQIIIDDVLKMENPDEHIASTLKSFEAKKHSEEERKKILLEKGLEEQRFLNKFSEAFLKYENESFEFNGAWTDNNDNKVEISENEDGFEAIWNNTTTDNKCVATVQNRGFSVVMYKSNNAILGKKEMVEYMKGYGLLDDQNSCIEIMLLDEENFEKIIFRDMLR